MFKKSYTVEKATKKDKKETESTRSTGSTGSTMTLKKKDKIKSMNNHESSEYRKKAFPKKVSAVSTKWVENKTFTPTKKKEVEKKKEAEKKK